MSRHLHEVHDPVGPEPSADSAYDPRGEVDLPGFRLSLLAYTTLVLSALAVGRATGQRLPERIATADLALGMLAVHKASRLVSRASVTSPLRAPFTRFEEAAGAAEHQESPRTDSRPRHTVGELITCPFCLDVWFATLYVGALTVAPLPTRAGAAILSLVTGADWLQHLYQRLRG